jgi:hypothetical protein
VNRREPAVVPVVDGLGIERKARADVDLTRLVVVAKSPFGLAEVHEAEPSPQCVRDHATAKGRARRAVPK